VDASMLAAKGCLGLNSPRIFCGVACVFDLPTPFLIRGLAGSLRGG